MQQGISTRKRVTRLHAHGPLGKDAVALGGLVPLTGLPLKVAARHRTGRAHLMPKTPDELFAYLEGLGIEVSTVTHPPLFTVADSQALRGEIAGGHTKNLFLKDKKDNYFLVTVEEHAQVDLKQIHHVIGAASRVSFGRPEALMELLGVIPGAVTAFGLINDGKWRGEIRGRS